MKRVVALGGRPATEHGEERAARHEHALELAHDRGGIVEQHEREVTGHDVERVRGERQRLRARLRHSHVRRTPRVRRDPRVGCTGADRPDELGVRQVDPDGTGAPVRAQLCVDRTIATREIEDARAGRHPRGEPRVATAATEHARGDTGVSGVEVTQEMFGVGHRVPGGEPDGAGDAILPISRKESFMSRLLAAFAAIALAAPSARAADRDPLPQIDIDHDRVQALDAAAVVARDERLVALENQRVQTLRRAWDRAVAQDHPIDAGFLAQEHFQALHDAQRAWTALSHARHEFTAAREQLVTDEYIVQHA